MQKQNKAKVTGALMVKPEKQVEEIEYSGANEDMTAEQLIVVAINKGVPVATMERLLAMRDKINAEKAKRAFDDDMAAFQGECPPIVKDKVVLGKDGKPRYRCAPLEVIVSQIKILLQQKGFSYSTDAIVEEGWVTAVCKVTHKAGHTEHSQFKVPTDKDAYMSGPQKFASALTFAKRYAFCNAFGILTADEDNDARTADNTYEEPNKPKAPITPPAPKAPVLADDAQKKMIFELGTQLEKEPDATKEWIKGVFKLESFDNLTFDQAKSVIESLKKKVDTVKPTDTDSDGDKPVDPPAEDAETEEPKDEETEEPFVATDEFKEDVSKKMAEFDLNDFQRIRLLMRATLKTTMPDNDLDWMKVDAYLDEMAANPDLLADIMETARKASEVKNEA